MVKNILLVSALLLTMGVGAQELKISNSNITERDNGVTVSFAAQLDNLASNQRLTLTPVLYSALGRQSLKPLVVVGRSRAISDQRIGLSAGLRYTKGESISYTITVPYQAWMGEVALSIERTIESCSNQMQLSSYTATAPQLIHYDIQPSYSCEKVVKELTELECYDNQMTFLSPISEYKRLPHEAINPLDEAGGLKIYFKQGAVDIDKSYRSNDSILTRVSDAISLIQSDPNATLEKIVILGLASPEGHTVQNAKLAAIRAAALKEYMSGRVDNAADIFDVVSAGANWRGLVQLVEASDMQYKQDVLDIIAKYDISDGRNKRLMDLKWGRPYNYMMKHFFPELRNAGYVKIYYALKPDTSVAMVNSALELVNDKRYREALEILNTLEDGARVNNLSGVALMMMGDYLQAELRLKKAIAQGSEDAVKNLQQMKTKQSIKQ